uniref:Kinesin-associated protein 3 n=1 Tax=Romanomermis culicivorax TaxID=13658 RepID=A0A915ISG5_ROMCU
MDEAKFLKKHIKIGTIDVHPTENAIVVNYRVEATVIGEEGESIFSNKQDCQKIIRISGLDNETDLKSLANEVVRRCHLIPEAKLPEIEQLLYYLQNKKSNKTLNNLTKSTITGDQSSRSNSSSNSLTSSTDKADLNNLSNYIDMLYDDMYTKNRGTLLILDLARRTHYLDELAQNDLLLGVLARVLREEWKKSIELTTNVINIFSCFSDYTQFHHMISRNKIGALCMQIMEYELKRYELFLRPSSSSSNTQQSLPAGRKDDDDFIAEFKIVDKIIKSIINWPRSNENLQIYTLPLLYHISMDVQCKSMFSCTDCISMCLKLCLSFDETTLFWTKSDAIKQNRGDEEIFDDQIFSAPSNYLKLPPFARRTTSPNSTNASMNNNVEIAGNCAKEKNERRSYIYKICSSLLINLSTNKRNAELIAAENFSVLKTLIEKAFDCKSRLLAHLLRNISMHDGPLKFFFVEYVGDFANAIRKIRLDVLNRNLSDNEARRRFAFGVECLLVLSNLNIPELNFGALIEEFNLSEWISEALNNAACQHESLILAILAFLGTVTGDANGATLLLERGVIQQLATILSAKQENDELVQHIMYVFYRAMFHENTRRFLIDDSKIPLFLMELMHDGHPTIRKLCDNSLDLISEHSVEWAIKIREERFKWHNAQWLEIVAGSSSNFANYSNQNVSDDQELMDNRSSSSDDATDSSDDLDHFITDEQLFVDDENNDQLSGRSPHESKVEKSVYNC